ncbi:MAG: AAA family ATPase [Clostridiales bacterium]|nr:AAA family ATPase [Clostridiales bacterium]
MLCLERFSFPDADREFDLLHDDYRGKMTAFSSYYPFGVLSRGGALTLEFEPVTVLSGSNGCGKTTALNVMAEALGLARDAAYNRTEFFGAYIAACRWQTRGPVPAGSRIVTSDDVFDFMLELRYINDGLDQRRGELTAQYWQDRNAGFRVTSLDDYERLKQVNRARRMTPSKYLKARMMQNIRTQSNGESAAFYFESRMEDGLLLMLDEPENSLSPARQRALADAIVDKARFFGCQFVIATHSPYLMAMRGAKVYDMDDVPVRAKRWTELPAVREAYAFFKEHADAFEK